MNVFFLQCNMIKVNDCLFVLYAFEHRTRQRRLTFQESSFHPGEGRGLLFPEIISPSSPRPPSVSNQWNCTFPGYVRGQAIIGFRGR